MISATIICKNEEKMLGDCLKSLQWCSEIVVIDSGSTDNTIGIAREYTDKIFIQPWKGFKKQREFALSKTHYDWVLVLDADERCSPELQFEILNYLKSENLHYNGFKIPRKNFFLNKWIKHGGWYPGYQYRFFNKKFTKVTDRLVHEGYEISGSIGTFKNNILHYTVTSISDFMTKVNQYSSLQAEEKSVNKTASFADLLFRPFAAFFVQYFFRQGFRDGIFGLMVAHFDVITNILTYMKIRELQDKKNR